LEVTEKVEPLLASPEAVTTTFPVMAPLGTGATILVSLQLAGVAVDPLKVMVLAPWAEPKFDPVMVTEVPTGPDAGDRLVITGDDGPEGVVTETLSNVAVERLELSSLLTAKPT
jgi:hypothetical protein